MGRGVILPGAEFGAVDPGDARSVVTLKEETAILLEVRDLWF